MSYSELEQIRRLNFEQAAEITRLQSEIAVLSAELATYRNPDEYPSRLEMVIRENAKHVSERKEERAAFQLLRTQRDELERELAALRAELESVRKGSAKVCREFRADNAALRAALTECKRLLVVLRPRTLVVYRDTRNGNGLAETGLTREIDAALAGGAT